MKRSRIKSLGACAAAKVRAGEVTPSVVALKKKKKKITALTCTYSCSCLKHSRSNQFSRRHISHLSRVLLLITVYSQQCNCNFLKWLWKWSSCFLLRHTAVVFFAKLICFPFTCLPLKKLCGQKSLKTLCVPVHCAHSQPRNSPCIKCPLKKKPVRLQAPTKQETCQQTSAERLFTHAASQVIIGISGWRHVMWAQSTSGARDSSV